MDRFHGVVSMGCCHNILKRCFTECNVYEKPFETSDIMSDAFELCVGHFHFKLDIFLFNIKTLDSVIKNSHIPKFGTF